MLSLALQVFTKSNDTADRADIDVITITYNLPREVSREGDRVNEIDTDWFHINLQ